MKFIFTKQHGHHVKVYSRLNKQGSTLLMRSESTFDPGEATRGEEYKKNRYRHLLRGGKKNKIRCNKDWSVLNK